MDQTTSCHTATVVTEVECAQGVMDAYDQSCEFLGCNPQALLHDNKPIHDESELREHIEKETIMIPATPKRGENKAVIEGEFGKYEQYVGLIYLDDSSIEALMKSAVGEIIRAYTAAGNHAGRVDFDGISRLAILRNHCRDPEKDREFLEQLHQSHTKGNFVDKLPTHPIARQILEQAFTDFSLEDRDPKGKLKDWLSQRYTPEAIRQGIAIFGVEHQQGRLRNKTAHRYLVKVIKSCREELDLIVVEAMLLQYTAIEQPAWLREYDKEYERLESEIMAQTSDKEFLFNIAEKAIFGSLIFERVFWEKKLKLLLYKQTHYFQKVRNHIKRLYEANWNDRFQLISKLVNWENQLVPVAA